MLEVGRIRIAGVAEDVTERHQLERPVVAVTSYPEQFEKKDALAAGCEAYLAKPIDTRKLPRLISNVRKSPLTQGGLKRMETGTLAEVLEQCVTQSNLNQWEELHEN